MNQSNKIKRTSKKLLVSLIAVLALLVICAGCKKVTPEEALRQAFKKTFTDTNPAEALVGLKSMNAAMEENTAYSSGASLTLEKLSGKAFSDYASLLEGIGFSVDSAVDLPNKKYESVLHLSYGGTNYLSIGGMLDDSKLYLTVPQLLDGSVSVNFSTLADDLASDSLLGTSISSFLDTAGIEIPKDFSFDFFSQFPDPTALTLPVEFIEAFEELDKAIEINELDVNEADLPNSVSAKKAYCVTIPQDALEDYLTELAVYVVSLAEKSISNESVRSLLPDDITLPDRTQVSKAIAFLAEQLGDIDITVAVNKSGYVCYMASELEIKDNTVKLTASFAGESSPLEDMEFKLSTTINGKTASLKFKESFDSKEKTVACNVRLSIADFSATIKSEGKYTDIEKGKKYTFDLNYLEFDCSEDVSFTVSGSTYFDVTGDSIHTPEGNEYELLQITQEELLTLITEVSTNLKTDPLFSRILDLIGIEF